MQNALKRTQPTIAILSAHQFVLEELQRVLETRGFKIRPRKISSGISELSSVALPRARVALIDGNAPTGVVEALVTVVLNRKPKMRVVVLLEQVNDSTTFPLLRAGVKGLLRYTEVQTQLPRALRMVLHGGYWVPRKLLSRFVESILQQRHTRPAPQLLMSSREREVLSGLMDNLSNKEIANKLNISERTVKFHVSNLLAKFGVQRRADLIVMSYQDAAGYKEKPGPKLITLARIKANGV